MEQKTLARYWKLLGAQRYELPRVLAASLTLSFVDVLGIGLVGPFIAALLAPHLVTSHSWYQSVTSWVGLTTADPVVVMALTLVAAFAAKLVVSTLVLAEISSFSARLDWRLKEDLLETYHSMSLTRISSVNSSSFVQAVHGFTGQFAYGLVGAQLRLVTEVLIAAAILAYLFYLNPMALGFLFILVAVIGYGYDSVFRRRIHSYGEESARNGETLIRAVQQIVAGMREIRIYGVEQRLLRPAQEAAKRSAALSARYQWISSIPKYLIEFCLMVAICALVIMLHSSGVPREEMFALIGVYGVAVVRLAPATNFVLNGVAQLRFNSFVIDKLLDELESSPAAHGGGGGALSELNALDTIELVDVEFAYPGQETPVLCKVNLQIKKGESVGLVGPSGGGKTTLAELILGFWEPSKGKVLLNGHPRADYRAEAWRNHFAYIPQQLFILDASIADNISLLDTGDNEKIRQRVNAAAGAAQLDSHLQTLASGIDSLCGENGAHLSGGQRQRVALARAFYHRRSVLVMDEATSALDYETEREIIEEIRALKGRVTMIVIAHRLETVMDCDRLFRVDGGRVIEIRHADLRLSRDKS